ncbi:tetratricopeptide repeat protein [Archangium violaceum]|uniref:tetratricopeptide repeat protein n=1 Tax=Archangium violaceum TaxID=83451 RepID=UPI0037C11E9D
MSQDFRMTRPRQNWHALATALLVLGCVACATVKNAPTDSRLEEAQQAFDEGKRLLDAGRYAEAEPSARRALELREAVLGGAHPEVAKCLSLLGLLEDAGHQDLVRAEKLHQRALSIYEATLGEDHPDVASSLNNLASLYFDQGRYEQAEPLLQRALAIHEATLGENHPRLADVLLDLAAVYVQQGHYTRAEPPLRRALAIREMEPGKKYSSDPDALFTLASLYEIQGYYTQAEPLYQRALEMREAAFGVNHPDVADSLTNVADLSLRQGAYARARAWYERAFAIREAVLGKNHPKVASSLHSLAVLLMEQRQFKEAEPLLLRALAIQEATLGGHHTDVAISLHNLATLYSVQGDFARAEPLYERALTIKQAALGSAHPDVAELHHELATLYKEKGAHAKAEQLYVRALTIQEAALGREHPRVAQVLYDLAALRLAQDHLAEALPLLERAFTISEAHLRQEEYGFSEARLTNVLRLLRSDEERLYALARAHPDNARVRQLALSAALLRKGRSVEEVAETSRIVYRGLGQADRETFERLRALRTRIAELALAGPGTLEPDDYQRNIKKLTDQSDALEADLARRSAPLRALFSLPLPEHLVARVAATLPSDGVLIEFVAYQDNPLVFKPGAPPSRRQGELRYLALLLFADGRTHAVELGPAATIDRAALRLHDALAGNYVHYQSSARALHALVFRPLVPLLGKARRIFLSPDGQLALVPFDALHDGRQFLIDGFDITYLTSGKELLPHHEGITPARSVVVLADPDFDSAPATNLLSAGTAPEPAERSASLERFSSTLRANRTGSPWNPLPGTRREAEAIHRMLPHAQMLMGRAATKDALLKLTTPGVLHIATHGFFMGRAETPAATRAVVNFGEVCEPDPSQLPADPLLRSGLVLAGAHAPGSGSGAYRCEDSLVTALELAGLDLWGTQLVVLSACETGRGEVELGQGVYGLRRALVVAGAQTLVTSLWKVDDPVTGQLMESYYRNLLAGQGRAEALRSAMRALRQKQSHPYYWAPFIAIGQDTPLQGLGPPSESHPAP